MCCILSLKYKMLYYLKAQMEQVDIRPQYRIVSAVISYFLHGFAADGFVMLMMTRMWMSPLWWHCYSCTMTRGTGTSASPVSATLSRRETWMERE